MIDWANRHPLVTNLIITLLVVVPGYLRIEQAAEEARDAASAVEVESARSTLEACHSRRDTIIVLRGLVELTSETSGGGSVDLTAVDGFDDLSADVRFYMANLNALINASPPSDSGFVDRALERLPIPDCTQEQNQ